MVTNQYVPDRDNPSCCNSTRNQVMSMQGSILHRSFSPVAYNGKVGLSLLCPVTSKIKGYPFEVIIPQDLPIEGLILSDQAKSLDRQARQVTFIKYRMRRWLR